MTHPFERSPGGIERGNEDLVAMVAVLEERLDLAVGVIIVMHCYLCQVLDEEQKHKLSDEMSEFIASFPNLNPPFSGIAS